MHCFDRDGVCSQVVGEFAFPGTSCGAGKVSNNPLKKNKNKNGIEKKILTAFTILFQYCLNKECVRVGTSIIDAPRGNSYN